MGNNEFNQQSKTYGDVLQILFLWLWLVDEMNSLVTVYRLRTPKIHVHTNYHHFLSSLVVVRSGVLNPIEQGIASITVVPFDEDFEALLVQPLLLDVFSMHLHALLLVIELD